MGAADSKLLPGSWTRSKQRPPPKLVLVPPMFERDLRARNRLANNAYDYLFSKHRINCLLTDYVDVRGPTALLYLSPPADAALTTRTKLGLSSSSLALRYQPLGADQQNAFVEVKAKSEGARHAQLVARACYFDPSSGWGVFATAPLSAALQPGASTTAGVGVRYSSPHWTAGAVLLPSLADASLSPAWLVARLRGVTAGLKLHHIPQGIFQGAGLGLVSGSSQLPAPSLTGSSLQDLVSWLSQNSSMAVSYTPPEAMYKGAAGRSHFTASLELVRGCSVVAAFHQHLAVTRKVLNPLEKDQVVGITNYIDVGIQMVTPIRTAGAAGTSHQVDLQQELRPGLSVAAAWQINKNWMVKARAGSSAAAVSVGLRGWFHPSFLLFGSLQYQYGGHDSTSSSGRDWTRVGELPLRWGVVLQVENFGAIRYERGEQYQRGRALLQRHEATALDIANAEGTGTWVHKQAAEPEYNPALADNTADFL